MAGISWIKLSVNIFDDEKIKVIRKLPEGDSITLVWIHLLCLAGKTNDGGSVYIGQSVPYTDEMLSAICDEPINVIRIAIETFKQFEMISIEENGIIEISNWEKHQNIEGMKLYKKSGAERQRLRYWRNKLKEIGINAYVDGFTDDVEELKIIYKDRNEPHENLTQISQPHGLDIDNNNNNKNKNKIKNKNIEIDNNNISKNFNDEEKITVDYYYRLVKNNTNKNDIDLVVNAINQYGWKNIFYTLWYLKTEQKANITSFKYVDTVLSSQKPLDEGVVEFVVNREIKNIKCNDYQEQDNNQSYSDKARQERFQKMLNEKDYQQG